MSVVLEVLYWIWRLSPPLVTIFLGYRLYKADRLIKSQKELIEKQQEITYWSQSTKDSQIVSLQLALDVALNQKARLQEQLIDRDTEEPTARPKTRSSQKIKVPKEVM